MPTQQRLMDHVLIKVDGNDLPPETMNDLIEVTVDTSLHLPDAFVIRLHDERLEQVDNGPFALGKEVEIAATPQDSSASRVLIKGEITSLEPEFGEGTQAVLAVRGYDRSHRLHRGTHTKTYVNMTDSDVANAIAREAGLRAQVDATSEVYQHILQLNQSHMEFLAGRARRIGYEFFVEDRTLYFRRPQQPNNELELEWGRQLRTFQPRLTLAEQVDRVIVRGWDVKNCQPISGEAQRGRAEPQTGHQQTGAQMASAAFSSANRTVVDLNVASQAEAHALAQAICDELSGAFIEAEGQCYGQPDLRAGRWVRLTSLGRQFSGTYLVTSATHVYRAEAEYVTNFGIHGRRAETLFSLLETTAQRSSNPAGPAIALVTSNNDPEEWGRVKLKFPWLADDVESTWARVACIGAGSERGVQWLPEVNDEVLVVFEQGDINRPYVIGGLWNGQHKPPLPASEALAGGEVHKRIMKTRAGHTLTFVDGSDEGVMIETRGGHKVTLADQDKKVVIETSGGLKLTLDDGSNEVILDSGGNLTLKSGANLTVEASGTLELKGQTFSLKGNARGEVDGGATLDVKGGLVRIN
ncbi:MAG: VgrG-related protein [Anaerolineae bacterium]